jgi:hypothetical protein
VSDSSELSQGNSQNNRKEKEALNSNKLVLNSAE